MLEFLVDLPRLVFFFIIAVVWFSRGRRALHMIHVSPQIDPHYEFPGSQKPLVSILVPVKNEESNIRECLQNLLAQNYSSFEIIVANDNSTDQTAEILQEFSEKITLVNVLPTPAGWTGKNFALHHAVQHAKGEWFLFTDADTRHETSSVKASLAHAESRDLEFLTLLPRCITGGFLENVLQPAMMIFIGLWFPMNQINDPKSEVHFANGQYILMTQRNYEAIGGHEKVKGEFLEDFAMMKSTKKLARRAQCAIGASIYGTRMYDSLKSLWLGWRRIFLHAFERTPLLIFPKILETAVFSFLPFVVWILCFKNAWLFRGLYSFTFFFGTLVAVCIWGVCAKAYGIIRAKKPFAIFFPVAALFLVFLLTDAWRMAILKKQTRWR